MRARELSNSKASGLRISNLRTAQDRIDVQRWAAIALTQPERSSHDIAGHTVAPNASERQLRLNL